MFPSSLVQVSFHEKASPKVSEGKVIIPSIYPVPSNDCPQIVRGVASLVALPALYEPMLPEWIIGYALPSQSIYAGVSELLKPIKPKFPLAPVNNIPIWSASRLAIVNAPLDPVIVPPLFDK